ncbi:MAG: hypothetical protein D4R40_00235 [Nitrosomonadaceae bacterium]|nr:MAG: hypothetical protein D4R40_00235 [Nitrosomonadaceae bacterium]
MKQDLRIYAEGLAFSDGVYDLRTLEVIISNYRKILDRLVSVQLGKRQITQKLRSQLDYEVQIKSGSIELLVNFLLEHKESIAAFSAALSADGGHMLSKTIVALLRDAISLRKMASEAIKRGISVNITIANSFNVASTINESNVSFDKTNDTILINDSRIL